MEADVLSESVDVLLPVVEIVLHTEIEIDWMMEEIEIDWMLEEIEIEIVWMLEEIEIDWMLEESTCTQAIRPSHTSVWPKLNEKSDTSSWWLFKRKISHTEITSRSRKSWGTAHVLFQIFEQNYFLAPAAVCLFLRWADWSTALVLA